MSSFLQSVFSRQGHSTSEARRGPALPEGGHPHLVLYKFDGCPYCSRVQRYVQANGVDGIQMADTLRDPGARETLLARTGRTQVPCLFIDGEPLFESLDIIDWLERYQEM